MGRMNKLKQEWETDFTVNRLKRYAREVPPKMPRATAYYLLDKVPIVEWMPHYMLSWLATDIIAGLTIGVMLIPQGLAYAKIATIPVEHGLYSSWLPAAFAVIMGTSKELSTGPTSLLGLLTAEIIVDLKNEYEITEISSAVALMVGVYCLILGLFNLGFLLNYVSLPVLTGFISATALIIGTKQLDSLVGLDDVPDGVFNIIINMIPRIPEFDGPTCGIGFGTIACLYGLQMVGRRWGKKHFLIKFTSSSRAVVALIIFTLISFLVNKDRGDDLLFAISKVETHGIVAPKMHKASLVAKVATRAVAPLLAGALEHLAVGKGFGVKNGYTIDEDQELNYLGVTNIVNSFFGAMTVGGAMSRTAVNSECGVKSPLNGAFTAAFILLTLYVLSPALYWIPKATLSAIIIMAVIHLFGPMSLFYKYWRISFADFAACMVSFWVTIFVSAEIGIGAAVGWSVAYTMLRSAFAKPQVASSTDNNTYILPQPNVVEGRRPSGDQQSISQDQMDLFIPSNVLIVNFNDAIFFPNALRVKNKVLQEVQILFPAVRELNHANDGADRSWSVSFMKKLERIRKERGVEPGSVPLSVFVWDFSRVPFIDVAAITALRELKAETLKYAGKDVQIRIYGMSEKVRNRFWRAEWKMVNSEEYREEGADVLYESLESAVWDRQEPVYSEKMSDAIEVEKKEKV